MNIIKAFLLIVTFFSSSSIFSQNRNDTNVIYDSFRQEYDSAVYNVGLLYLMPSDSVNLFKQNNYTIEENEANGLRFIYFKNHLLYKYQIKNSTINGKGYVYYPFSEQVAMQGTFKNGKLHGLLFVMDNNGAILELLRYKKGKFKRYVYHHNYVLNAKGMKLINKKYRKNGCDPLTCSLEIMSY